MRNIVREATYQRAHVIRISYTLKMGFYLFVLVVYYRIKWGHFTLNRHLELECPICYWHFVDGMWIAVFGIVYVWSYYEFDRDSWWPRPVIYTTYYNKIGGGFYNKKK